MIESVSTWPSVQLRHRSAPLLREREQYLTHLLNRGLDTRQVRTVAAYLLHIVRTMDLTSLRCVELAEIQLAAERWAEYKGPERRGTNSLTSPTVFARLARAWLGFHNCVSLPSAPVPAFGAQLAAFAVELGSKRGLSLATVNSYHQRTKGFLAWVSERHEKLSSVSVRDLDDFLAGKRDAGWSPSTIATQCQALRTFFRFAEEWGWTSANLVVGIRSPRVLKYTEAPRGPNWTDVRTLIRSAGGETPAELRAKAMLLLYGIYALRSSEVARLRLDDFDWRNETFTVRRAKRGGIQQFPIQYEVGEAILRYLRHGRPRCACRHVFLTLQLPYRPVGPAGMWGIVATRMRRAGVKSEHIGPHALRHACATRLLRKGSSLKEIAEFLGHRDARSVGIYAKLDKRALYQVAAFRLTGLR